MKHNIWTFKSTYSKVEIISLEKALGIWKDYSSASSALPGLLLYFYFL